MESILKILFTLLIILIIILFICTIFICFKIFINKYIEEEDNFLMYNKIITKNFLNSLNIKYPDEKIFKKTLEILEQKEKEKYNFLNEQEFKEKKKLEKELYFDYLTLKF